MTEFRYPTRSDAQLAAAAVPPDPDDRTFGRYVSNRVEVVTPTTRGASVQLASDETTYVVRVSEDKAPHLRQRGGFVEEREIEARGRATLGAERGRL